MNPLFGTIQECAINFVPQGWMPCDGRTLAIAENQALFSLLGTQFGGDGALRFALPCLPPRGAGLTWIIAVEGLYPTRAD